MVTYGVGDSHAIRDRTRERIAEARAAPEYVIIIESLGLPSDTNTHIGVGRGRSRGSVDSGQKVTRGTLGSGRAATANVGGERESAFIVLRVVLKSLFLASGQTRWNPPLASRGR